MALKSYVVRSLPSGDDYRELVSAFLGSQLMVLNDFSNSTTSIITDDPDLCARMRSCSVGFECIEEDLPDVENATAFVIFPPETNSVPDPEIAPVKLLDGIYNLLAGQRARLYVSLVKADQSHLQFVKSRVEEALSQKEIRITKSTGSRGSSSHSLQSDLFYGSDERRSLTCLLNMLNETSLANGSAYKILFVIDGDTKLLSSYLKSKTFILNSIGLRAKNASDLYREVQGVDAIPFSHNSLSRLLFFSDRIPRSAKIRTIEPRQRSEGVDIGNFLKDSVSESQSRIRIEESTLNLGAIITGLPGTGKTFAAMSIISRLSASKVIISPTKEWGEF
ncbi:MAG: hypothetical protein KGH54_04355, partial [Candidatus Micrarchaeota archaeon]|nr:hypothetical protein [Candidatus Micrarchaeota archaeon]